MRKRRFVVLPVASAVIVAGGLVVAAPAQATGPLPVPTILLGDAPAPTSAEAAADVDVPSPDVLLAKNLEVAGISAQVASLLVAGSGAPAPDESQVPSADSEGGGGSVPSALRLTVHGAYQTTTYRCVPASTQTVLQTMGVTVTQDTLASEEHTTTNGTYMGNAPKPLNRRETRNPYVFGTDTTDASDLLSRSIADIYNHKSAPMIGIQAGLASWRKSQNIEGLHTIAVYGYYTSSDGGLYVWDPYNDTYFGGSVNYGGGHAPTLPSIWAANDADNAKIVW